MDRLSHTRILIVTHLVLDAEALEEALSEGDFDEARFRAHLIARSLEHVSFDSAAPMIWRALDLLGPPGTLPQPGLSTVVTGLAGALSMEAARLL